MRLSHDNLDAVASLASDTRFQRLMLDVEKEREGALSRLLDCPDAELPQRRAELKAVTAFIKAVKTAPAQAQEAKTNLERTPQRDRSP